MCLEVNHMERLSQLKPGQYISETFYISTKDEEDVNFINLEN